MNEREREKKKRFKHSRRGNQGLSQILLLCSSACLLISCLWAVLLPINGTSGNMMVFANGVVNACCCKGSEFAAVGDTSNCAVMSKMQSFLGRSLLKQVA